jgi:hypothetical protein
MQRGPPGLTVKTKFFNRRRKGKDKGAFILEIPNEEGRTTKVQFGLAWLSIYHKQSDEKDFKVDVEDSTITKEATSKGKPMLRANCPTCGTKMAKFTK